MFTSRRNSAIRVISQINKIQYAKLNEKNKTANAIVYTKKQQSNCNKVSKRSFSSLPHFPTPEDPNNLMFVILALGVCYIVVKL